MATVDAVVPLLLVLGLGAALARGGMLGPLFVDGLNRLVYWVGIPCLVVHSLAVASAPAAEALLVAGGLASTSVLAVVVGLAVAAILRVPRAVRGTFLQAAFRGNIAFVGLPVLHFATREGRAELLALAVLVLTPVVIFHNVLAVTLLLGSRARLDRQGLGTLGREVAKNPIVLSGLLGGVLSATGASVPSPLLLALETVGHISVPLALLAIGATLVRARLRGRRAAAVASALLKVGLVPAAAFLVGRLLELDSASFRVLVVFAACPTAATSNILAARLGGDEVLASAAIVVSTVLSAVSLALVVALF